MRTFALIVSCFSLAACNSQSLDGESSDLAAPVDFAVDLATNRVACSSSGVARVVPCCGGAPPQCTPAPDGGCQSPEQICPFGQGCYLPCTPPPPFCIDVPPPCANSPGDNLCKCIMQHGGADPCQPSFGGNCNYNTINLPPGEIDCQCS